MRDASLSSRLRAVAREIGLTWRLLSPEQRVAGVAATLLVISTFGPFSFVEAAIALIGVAVLALLRMRAEGRRFHLPFGDGTMIAAAGAWCAFLIVVRVLDRPLGQNLLALGCALLLFLAGARERAKRPADDLPERREPAVHRSRPGRSRDPMSGSSAERPTERLDDSEEETAPLGGAVARSPDERETRPLGGTGARGRSERETRPLDGPETRPLPEEPPEMPAPPERGG